MKVFVSWSGGRSKAAAELLHDWIKCVVQASRPWISTRGIGRGSVWFAEINNELKDTSVGIICLTHQNKNSPWILFEAGALAKGLTTNKVCTFLVDLTPTDIQDPLAQFNHTFPTKEGILSLVATLNSTLESPLDSSIMLSVFETFWPNFEERFSKILKDHPQEVEVVVRSNDSMLEETLSGTRNLGHKIREMESQLSGSQSSLRSQNLSMPANLWSTPDISLDEGVSIIRDALKNGASFEETHRRMTSIGLGKKQAKELIEFVIMLGPPTI